MSDRKKRETKMIIFMFPTKTVITLQPFVGFKKFQCLLVHVCKDYLAKYLTAYYELVVTGALVP